MNRNTSDQGLDSERTALLVIDVQRALFSRPTPIYKSDEFIQRLNALIASWRSSKGLIVFIQHSNNKKLKKNTEEWRFHPDLNVNDSDIVIHKLHGNAFKGTNLKEILDSKGIENIVITGLVTQGCVRATCIGGHELGYRVILVKDGHSNDRKTAKKIIEKWNQNLSKHHAELLLADEVTLE
jgi:nicotinamidase-related amidase